MVKQCFIAIILFILFSITTLYSDSLTYNIKVKSNIDSVYIISKILIIGNEKTKDFIIIREMSQKEGDTLNIDILRDDLGRITNLGLFNKVEILPLSIGGNFVNLLITVEELWYILPIPQAGFKENDIKKFWGGINFIWNNFRGRNETVGFSFGLGYEPFVGISYSVPWIGEKEHFFGTTSIRYNRNIIRTSANENKESFLKDGAKTYESDYYYGNVTIGKYFNKYFNVSGSVGYNILSISDKDAGRTLSPDGVDNYVFLNLGFGMDHRDNFVYTLDGSYMSLFYWKYGLFGNLMDINKIKGDFRKYIPIKIADNYRITLALRNVFGISFGGSIPLYMYETFGSNNIIRGWDDYMIQGENEIGFYSEIRIPIIQPFYVAGRNHFLVKSLPVFRDFTYKYGLYLSIFSDVGGVWDRNQNFLKTKFYPGFGFGLNGTLTFNVLARLDFGYRIINDKISVNYGVGLSSSF